MYLYGKRGHDMKTLIKNGIVILDGIKRLNNGAVMIEGGKITVLLMFKIIILFLVFWIPIHMGRWDMILISIHQSRS